LTVERLDERAGWPGDVTAAEPDPSGRMTKRLLKEF
jgi:hypothetical protein